MQWFLVVQKIVLHGITNVKYILLETFFVACVCTFLYFNAFYVPNQARIAAKLCQNAFRTIPDISFFDKKNFCSKLRTAVYPQNMAPIGAKLCQNAFQVIPDISFFDAHKHFWRQQFLSE